MLSANEQLRSAAPAGSSHGVEAETGVASDSEKWSSARHRQLIWKLDVRLLPPLFILWFISLIDRVNIGTARIQGLEKDLGMNPSGNQFNIASGKVS